LSWKSLIVALPLCGLAGCIHINRPAVPVTVSPRGQGAYSAADFKAAYAQYQAAVKAGQFDQAKVERDAMINRIEVDIESNYREYEGKLEATRAALTTVGDATELGVSAAIGVVGATDVKDLLSAALTSLKGSRLSFDKNFFREKTTEILISKMEASRDAIRNRITQKMDLDVGKYPFEEAWRDLVEFFYAGTLQSAIVQLGNDAGAAAAAARKQAEDIDVRRAFTAQEASASARIANNFLALRRQALEDPDPARRAAAVEKAKAVLAQMGAAEKVTPTSTPADVMNALENRIKATLDHPEDIPRLDQALMPK